MGTAQGYGYAMIVSPPPAGPPAIEQPAAYEISYGRISGLAAPGTRRIVVRVGGRIVRNVPLRRRRFDLRVPLETGPTRVRVETLDRQGRRAGTTIAPVFGLPAAGEPRLRRPSLDAALQRDVRRLAASFRGASAIYVQSLSSGQGAAWNAKASFPGASTLKLAIAVAALSRIDGTPGPGSRLDGLLRRMLIQSDNVAANDVERTFGGSTGGGSALVNSLMRSMGLVDTEMYGGYIPGTRIAASARERLVRRTTRQAIPVRVDEQPAWGVGKRTTAFDLASLARAVWLASGARGPLPRLQPGFTRSDARYLLFLLAHVREPGRADREVRHAPGVAVLHKAGWINAARHDNALVFWRGGVYVVAVLTYRPAGPGRAADVLAGKVAMAALRRFRG
jgi:beta-lactamase class A